MGRTSRLDAQGQLHRGIVTECVSYVSIVCLYVDKNEPHLLANM